MNDTIDRYALRRAMYNMAFETDRDTMWKSGCWVRYRAVEQVIKSMPSAQRWIPCSERMPKTREWVLCQCRAGIMDVLRLTENGDWNKNYPHAEYMSGFVIAWMPLPEPYKVEE